MLVSTVRSSIDIAATAGPPNSTARNALPMPSSRHSCSDMLAATPGAKAPLSSMRIVSGTCSQIVPVTTTPVISMAPKPAM